VKSDFTFFFGKYEKEIRSSLQELVEKRVIERIWAKDYTVWKNHPEEISNRLDWLSTIGEMKPRLPELAHFGEEIRGDGFEQVILLGMGGSSLAPEFFAKILDKKDGLPLFIVDTTDPRTIRHYTEEAQRKRTLYVVSTKSGGTLETLVLFRHFFSLLEKEIGPDKAGEHFIAITDPQSSLVDLAQRHRFRKVFLNNPHIGGRYSAFSLFGLVPAALAGVDLHRLLESAAQGMARCAPGLPVEENRGALLGAMMGTLAAQERDKLTMFFHPPHLKSFGDWVEQLVAESTGKDGRGILPVLEVSPERWETYGPDRWFVFLEGEDHSSLRAFRERISQEGIPFYFRTLSNTYDLGEEMFIWELATAVSGFFLRINPFDQPNVETTKVLTKKRIETYREKGEETLDLPEQVFREETIEWFTTPSLGASLKDAFFQFLSSLPANGYLAVQAFLPYSEQVDRELSHFISWLRRKTHCAVTLGYGPRFLHSTGQLHKGDAGRGIFFQLVSENGNDLLIPGEDMTFALLKKAQALGDREALLKRGRRVFTILLKDDPEKTLSQFIRLFSRAGS